MARTETIYLGGREVEVRPLKLGQLRGLLNALNDLAGKIGGEEIDAAANLLVAGLPHENLTEADILDLDITLPELNQAVATVIRVAGRLKPLQPGEAGPQPAA